MADLFGRIQGPQAGETLESFIHGDKGCIIFDGEGGQKGVVDIVAAQFEPAAKTLKQFQVMLSRFYAHGPGLLSQRGEEIEDIRGRGRHLAERRQGRYPKEGEFDYRGSCNRFIPGQRSGQPPVTSGMVRAVAPESVDQNVGIQKVHAGYLLRLLFDAIFLRSASASVRCASSFNS